MHLIKKILSGVIFFKITSDVTWTWSCLKNIESKKWSEIEKKEKKSKRTQACLKTILR